MHARVGVVIVNWNGGAFLGDCLRALTRQTLTAYQIIVVDNASTDASADLAEAEFPAITLIRAPRNLGFAAANNLAAKAATACNWLALLNPDAFAEPCWLENLLRAAQSNPEYSFFGSRMLMAESADRLDGAGDVYHVSGLSWRRGHNCIAEKSFLHSEEVFSPCAAAALYRRDVYLQAGGFDEDYFCYFEDTDLAFRLRLMGQRCLYVPSAVVRHVGSALTGRNSDFSVYHGHRNLVWTYFKDMPPILFWLYLPQHLLLNLASLVWFSAQGRARLIFRSKWDALLGIPRQWRKRRLLQVVRQVTIRQLYRVMTGGIIPHQRRRQEPG